MKQYRFLKLVLSAGFLMSGSGCGDLLTSQKPPQLVLKEAEKPRVESWVYEKPRGKVCLDPGKKDYTVQELETANSCKDEYIERLEYRHGTLSRTLKEMEKK